MSPDDIHVTDKIYLGRFLRARRIDLLITQGHVANAMKLDSSIIALWEMNKRPVPHERLRALAMALECDGIDELLTAAEIQINGYFESLPAPPPPPAFSGSMARMVTEPDPLPLKAADEPLKTKVPPSTVPLAWCTSTHGVPNAPKRRHHHGPLPSWKLGPFLELESPGPAYVRPQREIKPVRWPEPTRTQAVEVVPLPGPSFSTCRTCGASRPSSGPGLVAHLEMPRHEAAVHRAEERERRLRTPQHQGHLQLGIACKCAEAVVA